MLKRHSVFAVFLSPLLALEFTLGATFFCAPSTFAQDITNLGGDLTSTLPGRAAIQVNAPNVTDPERRDKQLSGFGDFHALFLKKDGLGPVFNNSSCGGCHVDNGRGAVKFSRSMFGGSSMVVFVSLRGLAADGSPRDVPGVGAQLRDHTVAGRRQFNITLAFDSVLGKYPDGTRYTLQRPRLNFTIPKYTPRKLAVSLRMAPPIIGMGLLEAISAETLQAFADPNDADGDGISGELQYVTARKTGTTEIGRFGFKASHSSVEEQSAAAAFNDIGLTNPLFVEPGMVPEVSAEALDRLTVYQELAGVPPARNQSDPKVVAGKGLFQSVGCASCHKVTIETGETSSPELSNQTIHPFTDLLLHDMGPGLADTRPDHNASRFEWRTTPLWGLGFTETLSSVRARFLHDGRARTVEEAILWHGGEAKKARDLFTKLPKADRANLILFVRSL